MFYMVAVPYGSDQLHLPQDGTGHRISSTGFGDGQHVYAAPVPYSSTGAIFDLQPWAGGIWPNQSPGGALPPPQCMVADPAPEFFAPQQAQAHASFVQQQQQQQPENPHYSQEPDGQQQYETTRQTAYSAVDDRFSDSNLDDQEEIFEAFESQYPEEIHERVESQDLQEPRAQHQQQQESTRHRTRQQQTMPNIEAWIAARFSGSNFADHQLRDLQDDQEQHETTRQAVPRRQFAPEATTSTVERRQRQTTRQRISQVQVVPDMDAWLDARFSAHPPKCQVHHIPAKAPAIEVERSELQNAQHPEIIQQLQEKLRLQELQIDSLRHKLEEATVCSICHDRRLDCVMVPCGHRGACSYCIRRFSALHCMFCRKPVKSVIPTFDA